MLLTSFIALPVAADEDEPPPNDIRLLTDTVEVTAARANLIGVADSASQGFAPAERLTNTPLTRPVDVLEQVPGLVVTQHSGAGKAPQYYLRGFNLDHGTDFSISLEGTPVNMRTHGHGQGYADANFLIPELIESIEFRKGPYFADLGDFSLAGAARINYYHTLPQDIASTTIGEDGYRRLLLAGSTELGPGNLLYALEGFQNDGPFERPENFHKFNGVLRWGTGNAERGFDVLGVFYNSRGDASNQIPQRGVDAGLIDRFGAIDQTDASRTHRYSLSADWRNGPWKANAYYIDYRLNLFSNFTYFLDDPVNGDQFEQLDKRGVYGGAISRDWHNHLGPLKLEQRAGMDFRYDDIRSVGLFSTVARQRLSTTRDDEVEEASTGIWWQGAWQASERLRATLGLRFDYYDFKVQSNNPLNSGETSDRILSPKFGLSYQLARHTELYFNYGRGFHSNDARGTTISVDPKSGEAAERVPGLVSGEGGEIGVRGAWMPNWQTTLALFQLNVDSELVFVGDAGNTEAGRPSKRVGVEWTNHYRPVDWLFLDADLALSRARFRDSSAAGDEIPGAIEKTASISVTAGRESGWYGAARFRYFGPRPLIEDNSQRSDSTITTNARIGYRASPRWDFALDVINLFDREDSEIDYFYTSRLPNEPAAGVDDIHFHPILPRTLRFSVQFTY